MYIEGFGLHQSQQMRGGVIGVLLHILVDTEHAMLGVGLSGKRNRRGYMTSALELLWKATEQQCAMMLIRGRKKSSEDPLPDLETVTFRPLFDERVLE